MELGFESVASSAPSLRHKFPSTSPFHSSIRFHRSIPIKFRDQNHVLFYQSPICKSSTKAERMAMAEIASGIVSLDIERDLLAGLVNLKLQMKAKKRDLKEHKKAMKAALKEKKGHKHPKPSTSSSSESSESGSENTMDGRTSKEMEASGIDQAAPPTQQIESSGTIEPMPCPSSQEVSVESKTSELEPYLSTEDMPGVSKPIELEPDLSRKMVSKTSELEPYLSTEDMPGVSKPRELEPCLSRQIVSMVSNLWWPMEGTPGAERMGVRVGGSCRKAGSKALLGSLHGKLPATCWSMEGTRGGGRIEVCVGGSCRKAGSKTLLGSLQQKMPANAVVCAASSKCMGRCGQSISLKITKHEGTPHFHSQAQVDDADWLLRYHFGVHTVPTYVPSLELAATPSFAA